MGFGVPIGQWYRQSGLGAIRRELLGPDARAIQVLDKKRVARLLEEVGS